jgi:hypothetical protein
MSSNQETVARKRAAKTTTKVSPAIGVDQVTMIQDTETHPITAIPAPLGVGIE